MEEFFGFTKLDDYALYLRGVIITVYAIFIFRVNLSRIYGNHSPLDFIIYIILGAILGEAIVNNIPLLPSIVVSTLIIGIYRFLTWLTYKNHTIGKYIKGDKITLIRDGAFIQKNMEQSRVTENDVLQALRLQQGTEDLSSIHLAILERGGQISFQIKSA